MTEFTKKDIILSFIMSFIGGFVGSFLMTVYQFGWHETMRRMSGLF